MFVFYICYSDVLEEGLVLTCYLKLYMLTEEITFLLLIKYIFKLQQWSSTSAILV